MSVLTKARHRCHPSWHRSSRLFAVSLIITAFSAFAGGHALAAEADTAWRTSRQMVLVVIPDWNTNHGVLHAYERKGSAWQPIDKAQPVTIGSAGAAWDWA